MQAFVMHSPGQAALTEVPPPEPAEDEVLVRIEASSVNPHDGHVLSGAAAAYLEYEYPITLGTDLAGTVLQVGRATSRFQPGQRVYGLVRERVAHRGTFAQQVAVNEDFLLEAPDNVPTADCGVFGLSALTALRCLDATGLGPGSTLFVNGATGGVGTYLVQAARAAGLQIVATAAPDARQFLPADDATAIIDWTAGNVADAVTAQVGAVNAMVDLVTAAPDQFAELANHIVRPDGVACSTLNVASGNPALTSSGVDVISISDPPTLQRLSDMVSTGVLTAPITQTFTLQEIDQALTALGAGGVGKISVLIA